MAGLRLRPHAGPLLLAVRRAGPGELPGMVAANLVPGLRGVRLAEVVPGVVAVQVCAIAEAIVARGALEAGALLTLVRLPTRLV